MFSRPQDHSAIGNIMSMKNSNDTIVSREVPRRKGLWQETIIQIIIIIIIIII